MNTGSVNVNYLQPEFDKCKTRSEVYELVSKYEKKYGNNIALMQMFNAAKERVGNTGCVRVIRRPKRNQ